MNYKYFKPLATSGKKKYIYIYYVIDILLQSLASEA